MNKKKGGRGGGGVSRKIELRNEFFKRKKKSSFRKGKGIVLLFPSKTIRAKYLRVVVLEKMS